MLQCHVTYHAWHGTHKLGHLPTPRGWPTRRPGRRGSFTGWTGSTSYSRRQPVLLGKLMGTSVPAFSVQTP